MTTIAKIHTAASISPATKGKVETTYLVNATNTKGEDEVYQVTVIDLGEGKVNLLDVFVERKNGRFAILNKNTHSARYIQVGHWVVGEHKKG